MLPLNQAPASVEEEDESLLKLFQEAYTDILEAWDIAWGAKTGTTTGDGRE
jgi:hypothetical protein